MTVQEEWREGDSARAKFLRWKDEVLPTEAKCEFMDRRRAGEISISPEEHEAAYRTHADALTILLTSPDDQEAYSVVCSTLALVCEGMKRQGIELPPWKDPPGL